MAVGNAAWSQDRLEAWTSGYYLDPRPDLVPQALAAMRAGGHLGGGGATEPAIAFLSQVFRAHPEQVAGWVGSLLDPSDEERLALAQALWLADSDAARAQLAVLADDAGERAGALIGSLMDEPAPALEEVPLDEPSVLDMLWAAFLASGEERYVQRVIGALAGADEGLEARAVAAAARWSLVANARQHPAVVAICRRETGSRPADVAAALAEVVAEAAG